MKRIQRCGSIECATQGKEQIVKRSYENETRERTGNGARNLGGHLGYGDFNGRVDCLKQTTKKRPRRAA